MKSLLHNFAHPLHLISGLVLWALYFVIVYGGLSVACAYSPADAVLGQWSWINLGVLLLTVGFTLPLLWQGWCAWGQRQNQTPKQRFIVRVSGALYLVAGLATLAVGLPALFYPPCL